MPKIFGRESTHDNAVLASCVVSLANDVGHRPSRYLGINLLYDDRISEERGNEFQSIAFDLMSVGAPTAQTVLDALRLYRTKQNLDSGTPAGFSDATSNANNIVQSPIRPPTMYRNQRLVTILDISGLAFLLAWARENGDAAMQTFFSDFPLNGDPIEEQRWFEMELSTSASQRSAMANMFHAANVYMNSHPYQPTWVGLWEDFERFIDDGPDRWCEAFGVCRGGLRWQAVLTYKAERTSLLARPTQLDAGTYSCHFPTPNTLPQYLGGHPMFLSNNGIHPELIREFIHPQIPFDISYWTDGGSRIGRTTDKILGPIASQREAHYRHLQSRYSPLVISEWMPSAV